MQVDIREFWNAQNMSFRLQRNNVEFRIRYGDLFDVGTEVIVNSEQSDFILAHNSKSISGCIRTFGGESIQEQLDAQTNGGDLPVGTVLETDAGHLDASIRGHGSLKRIYHAAIHSSYVRNFSIEQSEGAELEVVETCIREILRRFDASGYGSIAIPLLGSGLYGLDARLVAATIAREVYRYTHRARSSRSRKILLVLHSFEREWFAMQSATQVLIDHASTPAFWEPIHIGIPLLDRFESIIASAQDPSWRAMQMCRYVELLSHHLLAVVASTMDGRLLNAMAKHDNGIPLMGAFSFGNVSTLLVQSIKTFQANGQPDWKIEVARFASEKHDKLEKFRFWRNDLAHGRIANVKLSKAEDLLRDLLNFPSWISMPEVIPKAHFGELAPWIIADDRDGIHRIVEQIHWKEGNATIRYLDPVESTVISRILS